jgi:hypothetical protein
MWHAKQRIAQQDDGVDDLVAGLGPRQPERELRSWFAGDPLAADEGTP